MTATLLNPGEGETFSFGSTTVTYKARSDATGDALGVYELTLAAGSPGAGLHVHKVLTEIFHVLKGELTIALEDGERPLGPGGFALVPPGAVHGFSNQSDAPVTFMLTFSPALAREGFFEGFAALDAKGRLGDEAAMRELMAQFDQEPVGPYGGWNGQQT